MITVESTKKLSKRHGGLTEIWFLKFNDPQEKRALWIRFTLLKSRNAFRKAASVWLIYFERGQDGEVKKQVFKENYDLGLLSNIHEGKKKGIKIASCELFEDASRGSIRSRGTDISWDLKIDPGQAARVSYVPPFLSRLKLFRNSFESIGVDLKMSGTCTLGDQKIEWKAAPGMLGHFKGPRLPRSWVWAHCNSFITPEGEASPVVFEGLRAKEKIFGPYSSPWLSTLFILYKGIRYELVSVIDSFRTKTDHSFTEWTFRAEKGDLTFQGEIQANLKDFAGLTYEDTNNTMVYCSNTKLASMKLHVYRKGQLEASLISPETTTYEVATREKSPYVPLLT